MLKAFDGMASSLDLAYWVCIHKGLGTKRSLDLSSICTVIKNLDGRDKVTKVIQYACRFLWWYYRTYHPKDESGPRYEKMFRTSQSARKCFHLLRTLEEIEKLQALLEDKRMPEWRRTLHVIRAGCMAVYWYYDNRVFFVNAKLSSYDSRKALTRDGLAWTVASLISMFFALEELKKHHEYRRSLERQKAAISSSDPPETTDLSEVQKRLKQAEEKQLGLIADFIRPFGDLIVACNSPGLDIPLRVTGHKLNDGVIGVAGLLSAVFALYKVYPAAVRPQ